MALKAKMKIVVVDHVQNMRQATRKMLNQVGLKNVIEAQDAEACVKILNEGLEANEPVEFIITEWDLPKMTGLEFVKSIKDDSNFKHIPILMVTGNAEQQIIIQAIQAGVANFVVKPFSSAQLQEKIAAIFMKKQKKAA